VIGVLLQATPSPSPIPAPLGANVIGFSFLLSLMVWGPAVVAVITAVTPEPVGARRLPWGLAFWTTLGVLVLAIAGYSQFQSFTTGLQFEERMPWMPRLGVSYHLGVDGISMALLVLNGLVFLCAVLASWEIRERGRQYFSLLLFAEAGANGVLAAQDAFLLLLFWAAGILPVALLVAGWAGARGPAAAARLAAFWGAGTATLLVAVLLLYDAAGASSFDLGTLAKPAATVVQVLVGVALTVTAATRLPLVPGHGWVREAVAEAPAGVAILTMGAVSRLGGYLLVRLLAGAEPSGGRGLAPNRGGRGGRTAIYAVVAASSARDLRRLATYLALLPGSVTVLGVAGLTPLSLDGTVVLLFGGGLAAALMVGSAITLAERAQARELGVAAGLAGRAPKLVWLLLTGGLAVLGMPFLATFPGALMVFLGSFRTQVWAAFVVGAGLVLGGVAVARLMHRVAFGAPNPDAPSPGDSSLAESWCLGVLVGALLWVGLVPSGPKLFGNPIFLDQGLINVVNSPTADLAVPYAPPAPPSPKPSPSASPAASPSASPSASPAPSPSPSP
jgi:NADH-quinone oxidoreductase subunit M